MPCSGEPSPRSAPARSRRRGNRERAAARPAICKPLEPRQTLTLRTMSIAAGIVGDADLANPRSARHDRRAPASACFDRGHDLALIVGEPVALHSAKSVAVAAKNIRHLQLRTHDAGYSGGINWHRESVEGAWRVGDQMRGDMCIARRRRKVGCPSNTWMMRISTPASRRWVAKLCHNVCAVTGLSILACFRALRQASCKAPVLNVTPMHSIRRRC